MLLCKVFFLNKFLTVNDCKWSLAIWNNNTSTQILCLKGWPQKNTFWFMAKWIEINVPSYYAGKYLNQFLKKKDKNEHTYGSFCHKSKSIFLRSSLLTQNMCTGIVSLYCQWPFTVIYGKKVIQKKWRCIIAWTWVYSYCTFMCPIYTCQYGNIYGATDIEIYLNSIGSRNSHSYIPKKIYHIHPDSSYYATSFFLNNFLTVNDCKWSLTI